MVTRQRKLDRLRNFSSKTRKRCSLKKSYKRRKRQRRRPGSPFTRTALNISLSVLMCTQARRTWATTGPTLTLIGDTTNKRATRIGSELTWTPGWSSTTRESVTSTSRSLRSTALEMSLAQASWATAMAPQATCFSTSVERRRT